MTGAGRLPKVLQGTAPNKKLTLCLLFPRDEVATFNVDLLWDIQGYVLVALIMRLAQQLIQYDPNIVSFPIRIRFT